MTKPAPVRDDYRTMWTFGERFVKVWWAGPGLYTDRWPGACQEWVQGAEGVWLGSARDALTQDAADALGAAA